MAFENLRDHGGLDGGRVSIAFVADGTKERLGEAEIGKLCQNKTFMGTAPDIEPVGAIVGEALARKSSR